MIDDAVKYIGHLFLALSLLLSVILLLAVYGHSTSLGAEGYVLASNGSYVVVNQSSLETVRTGNIWSDVSRSRLTSEGSKLVSGLSVLDVVTDNGGTRAFLLFGDPKAGEYMGFLVFQVPKFVPIGIIRQSMTAGPVTLLPDTSVGKIYVTYLKVSKPETELEVATAIFDASTFELSRERTEPSLQLSSASCALDDGRLLYANSRVFDARRGEELRKSRFWSKPYLDVDCKDGLVLLISASPNKRILLTIYNPKTDKIVSEIATDSELGVNRREWKLSPDGQAVIQDEQKVIAQGDGRMLVHTGRLVLYDVRSASKAGEIRLPGAGADSRIVGQSADGTYLFYGVSNKLYVLDRKDKASLRELNLGFEPVGVVWP